MQKIIFLDTETTGNKAEDRLCQVAAKFRNEDKTINQLFKPPLPISVDSMAVCHITNKMVEGKPSFIGTATFDELKNLLESDDAVLVAHNAQFDIGMLKKEGINPKHHICTLKIARMLDTECVIPKYTLQYLRYYLGIEIEATAHDALGDVLVLEEIFNRLLKKMTETEGSEESAITKMVEISSKPILFQKFFFGKYNGQKIEDVVKSDRGYLEWLLNQKNQSEDDGDEDLLYTLKFYLGKV